MQFEPRTIYHVYNQGNNRQQIFFQPKNYKYFLRKMAIHLLPFADLLCYCLMPNHFHWLIYTRPEACLPCGAVKPRKKSSEEKEPLFDDYQQTLCHSIGVMLGSYTRAINNQEDRSGSLFRNRTKAKNGWIEEVITLHGPHSEKFFRPDNDYARQCFHYIHQNPVKAGLVVNPQDWAYSSSREFAGYRKSGLCNLDLAQRLLGISNSRA